MRRSAINRQILEAHHFFTRNNFILPPFAGWTVEDWKGMGDEVDEIRMNRLGWDVTDFHSGKFDSIGLTLFTLRNGLLAGGKTSKVYAEKIMFVQQNQLTPFHFHAHKTEDIINRGGEGTGLLVVNVYNSDRKSEFMDGRVKVVCDGVRREVEAGANIIIGPGESITLPPYLYHSFHATDGHALIGEVSSFNNDDTDNYFKEALPRYPEIVEDQSPLRLLCTEYPWAVL